MFARKPNVTTQNGLLDEAIKETLCARIYRSPEARLVAIDNAEASLRAARMETEMEIASCN
jgi:hypothetical protein